MGRQPSVVIIARHGARLDQANKDWQASAEKPWDSPLSYGGWIQSQTLGARITKELDALDVTLGSDAAGLDMTLGDPRPRKKRRLAIHSSPYLRCVQTSIGIAAGMRYPQETSRTRPIPAPIQRSSLSQPPMVQDDESSTRKTSDSFLPLTSQPTVPPELTTLKLDAFLGEWLSGGYYEKTSPPPASSILVEAAKEMLQQPAEDIRGADLVNNAIHEFDQMDWDGGEAEEKQFSMPEKAPSGLRAMAVLGHSLPKRSRTVSFGKDTLNNTTTELKGARRQRRMSYSPPVPTYSIAPQDAIPIGFVAHARNACIEPDFQWDSQKAPLEWGDGGEYEEDWSVMHRRFRNGLQQLLSYYDFQSTDMEADEETDDDNDEDLVVILVTHQAGCNALIRLVTGAPALHDVGTASLTLAVRKQEDLVRKESIISISPTSRRRGSLDLGLGEEFDMRIIASTEHLRAGSNPLGLNSPRLGKSPAFASRRLAGPDSMEGFSIGDPLSWRSSSHHGLGRSSSLRSNTVDSSSAVTPMSGSGLWSNRPTRNNSTGTMDGSVDPKSSSVTLTQSSTIHEEDEVWDPNEPPVQSPTAATAAEVVAPQTWQAPPSTATPKFPTRSASHRVGNGPGMWGSDMKDTSDRNGGLWATSRSSFGEGSIARAKSPGKRRWTAVDRPV